MQRRALDERGWPRFGAYDGELEDASLDGLAGIWRRDGFYRFFHNKCWRWGMVADGRTLVAFALADLRYTANAFVFAVDLESGASLADRSALGMPWRVAIGDRPNAGAAARFEGGGLRITIDRPTDATSFAVAIRARELAFDADLDASAGPPSRVLIAAVPEGTANVTQKTCCLPARATLRVGGTERVMNGALGGLDYTNGLLARRTAWRWAFAAGRVGSGAVGLNLVDGFNDASDTTENVWWRDGAIGETDRARFRFDHADPLRPWRIATDDDRVDLVFTPRYAHREHRNLVVARSRFVQVAGTFSGVVGGGRVSDIPGVVEDQDVVW